MRIFLFLLFPISLFSQDCLVRITLFQNGKELVISTSDIAYVIDIRPDTVFSLEFRALAPSISYPQAIIAIRPNVQRYEVYESIDDIVAGSCKTLAVFTNERNGQLTAMPKSFIMRAESNVNNKADIFSKDARVRYSTDEAWTQMRIDLVECPTSTDSIVTPGVYANPTIRVRPDGRIDFIESGLICCTGDSVYVQTFAGDEDFDITVRPLPADTNAIFVYLNGQFIRDYVVSGNSVIPTIPIYPEDSVAVMFFISTNTFFREDYVAPDTISHSAPSNAVWFVYVNGLQTQQYSLIPSGLLLNFPVEPEDVVSITYFATTLNHYTQNFDPAGQTVSVTICPLPFLSDYISAFFNGQFTRMFDKSGDDITFVYDPQGLIHLKIFR